MKAIESKPARPYADFLAAKTRFVSGCGFEPLWMPDFLFPFQRSLVEWAIRKGRAAIFADCGLGKTPMQLVWAQNVVERTCKPVLILTPLAVGAQTVREAEKFGIESKQSRDGTIPAKITVTNYQQLHKFDWQQFGGVVCDESSILKNFDGSFKEQITEFMKKLPYRLLCTATAAPNDYIELGTSAEALGYMRRMEMLGMFFTHDGGETSKWRIKGHAGHQFWRWVCSWARAIRFPSDMGFPNDGFVLPELNMVEHIVAANEPLPGFLFDLPACTLDEQRHERRRTINQRCEVASELAHCHPGASVLWCHLNTEGDLLNKLLPGSVQVSGADDDDKKEEAMEAFALGQITKLITKPSICGFGMNWQHCAHQTFFPSHSFEQWYQATRRSWRFGQKNPVRIDIVTSDGERGVLENMKRKTQQASAMFEQLVKLMHDELILISKFENNTQPEKAPLWL